jgi:hypothetical protein
VHGRTVVTFFVLALTNVWGFVFESVYFLWKNYSNSMFTYRQSFAAYNSHTPYDQLQELALYMKDQLSYLLKKM